MLTYLNVGRLEIFLADLNLTLDLTSFVTRGCCLVENSPAPVVLVLPVGASLDQQLQDLVVAPGGGQVERSLVGRSSPAHAASTALQ